MDDTSVVVLMGIIITVIGFVMAAISSITARSRSYSISEHNRNHQK